MPKLDTLARESGDYRFAWRLVVNCIGKNSHTHTEDNLWLVGYELESVEQPTLSIPPNVRVSEVGPNSVALQWDASGFGPEGIGDDCYYAVGLLDSGSTTNRVATWKQTSARNTQFTWEGLLPNTAERFVVKAVRGSNGSGGEFVPAASSAPSPPVGVRTLGAGVKKVSFGAFKSNKALVTLVLKTKGLAKKSSVKGSLKGSKVKTVKVKLGSKSANKKYIKKYKKTFAKKNSGKCVKVK